MKTIIQKTYMNLLKEKAKSIKEPKLEYLYDNHLFQALNLFNIGKSNNKDIFFRDSISRANKVFEGIVRLLYDLAKSIDSSLNAKRNDVYNFINELMNKAKTSIHEAIIFYNIGLDVFDLIRNSKVPLNDKDYFHLIFQNFIESFAIYSEFFQLYEKRYNGIYIENIGVLLELIEDYYKDSLFSDEFSLSAHGITNKLRPSFKISLKNNEITFTVIKISDYDLAHKSKVLDIRDRVEKYINTFNNLYFLIWSFTKRKALNQYSFFRPNEIFSAPSDNKVYYEHQKYLNYQMIITQQSAKFGWIGWFNHMGWSTGGTGEFFDYLASVFDDPENPLLEYLIRSPQKS